jgi:hypothetical protein
MVDERAAKPMRIEYHIFLAVCVLGLTAQVWLLANEFTRSSLPIITQEFEGNDVPPATTLCFPWKYSIPKSEWFNYMGHILEAPTIGDALKLVNKSEMNAHAPHMVKIFDGCKSQLELAKSENK